MNARQSSRREKRYLASVDPLEDITEPMHDQRLIAALPHSHHVSATPAISPSWPRLHGGEISAAHRFADATFWTKSGPFGATHVHTVP